MRKNTGSDPDSSPAVLRDMVATDIDAITALDKMLFGVDSWPREMFVAELSQPETRRYIIAELPSGAVPGEKMRAAGYAGLMCVPPIGDIQTIGVLAEYEGRGIARAMLDELIAEAVRRGAEDIMLEVSSTNPRAQKLYARYGFEHIHTRRKYYRDGSDGLIMRLQLASGHTEKTTEKDLS
ncbi:MULTISPECIES: ribosomal protein S18-alanine N-acetyltransferase [Arthrobacter]|uniref:Ribosomal-protein-alanine N-acetyltransferase n=1 Tax=Arthrobacter psychrochitiniphilus TaxID=291045 RepID=A0A2V3DT26_9MICC|nr:MULTISPECIES: ribosomal protein S18-alanine N-acetyltransferase [Arthrobacter]NYG18644.1 ribosomal-protein-alanine N-acetyltransferase [Arthrobacter psychrochitiniphilus]PXA66413.1 ribosomal-protein-alanine N-acetyltransferase [Arthrobacter psychrochitiniphilus]